MIIIFATQFLYLQFQLTTFQGVILLTSMEDIPNEESPNPFLISNSGTPKDNHPKISFFAQFIAVVTLDKKTLRKIPYVRDAKINAVILIYLSLILDAVGISGFDFRMTISGWDPYVQLFVLQPMFLLLLAVIFRIALKLHGILIDTSHVFIMIGYSHIWTILSGLLFFIPFNSLFLVLLLFILLDILYLSAVILAFVDSHWPKQFLVGFSMNILFFLSFFILAIPILFLASFTPPY